MSAAAAMIPVQEMKIAKVKEHIGAIVTGIDLAKTENTLISSARMSTGNPDIVKAQLEATKPPTVHPLVRTHPETARRSLYFDPGKIVGFVGIDDREADDLIAELTLRMIVSGAEYHHVWRNGDIVIWDNRCSYHKAAGDYPPEEDRIHWRVSINDVIGEAKEAA